MPDCSNSLPVDMLIGLYGSHHINIPTKHFNFQLSIFNSSSIQAIVYFQLSIFLPSLCLRSTFALGLLLRTTPQRPQKGSSTELDMPPATATVATVRFPPNRSSGLPPIAVRKRWFSNCSNRSVAPTASSAPPACSSATNLIFFCYRKIHRPLPLWGFVCC